MPDPVNEAVREKVARAIYETQDNPIPWDSPTLGDWRKDYEREKADAAIAVIEAERGQGIREVIDRLENISRSDVGGDDGSWYADLLRREFLPARSSGSAAQNHEVLSKACAEGTCGCKAREGIASEGGTANPRDRAADAPSPARSPQGEDHEGRS